VNFFNEGLFGPVGFSSPNLCGAGPNHEKWANLLGLLVVEAFKEPSIVH